MFCFDLFNFFGRLDPNHFWSLSYTTKSYTTKSTVTTKQDFQGTAWDIDGTIGDDDASEMAIAILTQLQLALTHTQIRQISTIISEQYEKSKLDNSVKSKRPIPCAVLPQNQTRDNSSASQVSALTESSQLGRVPALYSTFTNFAANSGNVINAAGLEFSAEGKVRYKDVVSVGESVDNTMSSPQEMPPPPPMVKTPIMKNGGPNLPKIQKTAEPDSDDSDAETGCVVNAQKERVAVVNRRKTIPTRQDLQDLESSSDESDEVGRSVVNSETNKDVDEVDTDMTKKGSEGVLKRTNAKICYHLQYDGSFYDTMSENGYFKDSYLATRPNAPKQCAVCNRSFNSDDKDYIVGSKHQVYACANARDLTSECVHALCSPCYHPKAVEYARTEDTTGRRGRQHRRLGGTKWCK
jgi:hypothetical protein